MLQVRSPKADGSLYPSDPEELNRALDLYGGMYSSLVGRLINSLKDKAVKALILPYTDYRITFYLNILAYKLLFNNVQKQIRLFFLCNSDDIDNRHISLLGYSGWKSPIGTIDADVDFMVELSRKFDKYLVTDRKSENSYGIEVQIPILSKFKFDKKLKIVPVVFNENHNYKAVYSFLKKCWKSKNNYFVVLSNLSQDKSITTSKQVDDTTRRFIENKNVEMLMQSKNMTFSDGVVGLMKLLVEKKSIIKSLIYYNSGDMMSNKVSCTGYNSFISVV